MIENKKKTIKKIRTKFDKKKLTKLSKQGWNQK
jgi:hypothetical protein